MYSALHTLYDCEMVNCLGFKKSAAFSHARYWICSVLKIFACPNQDNCIFHIGFKGGVKDISKNQG